MEIRRRWEFLRETQFRKEKGLLLMAIILLRGGFELYEFIRTHFYPEKNWPLARDILEWMPWYWWVIAVLCLLVIFLFEGGFHAVRNRDKAIALQSDINKIPQSGPMALGTPDSPIITEPVVQIHLDNFPYATGYGLTDGFPNESSPDTFWVKVFAEIEITQNANIETLELKLGNERIPVHREPKLEFQRFHYHWFEIPRKVIPERHMGQLIAKADGKWWASKEFSIQIPKR